MQEKTNQGNFMKVYLVGGAVRDKLLGRAVHDADYVVVGGTPEQMLEQGFSQVGADFPVFLHPISKQEYALARTERKSGKGYTGFTVHASPDVTLEDDLIRRDLTINAMAIEVNGLFDATEKTDATGKVNIIDPYGGLADMENRLLRHVSPAFSEDPLRVLRVARFYARYYDLSDCLGDCLSKQGFTIADETFELMKTMVANGELDQLSRERIWVESERATLGQYPDKYWQTLYGLGALSLFPPLQQYWENNPAAMQTTLKALSMADDFKLSIEQRWAVLMATFADGLSEVGLTQNLNNPLNSIPSPNPSQREGSSLPPRGRAREGGCELHKFSKDGLSKNDTKSIQSKKEIKDNWQQAMMQVHQANTIPKKIANFAKLYAQVEDQLAQIESLSANQLMSLLQQTNSHKQPEQFNKLLMVQQLLQSARFQYKASRLMDMSLASYQAVTIKDIDPTLKGKAIGEALEMARVQRLSDMLL